MVGWGAVWWDWVLWGDVMGWDGESYCGMGSHRVVWGVVWWDGES